MRRLALILLAASAPVLAPDAAAAQSSATGPDITVTGDDHMVCRRVTRTATRMRTGRICRTQAQWARDRTPSVDPNNPNATIDGAADTLDALAADDISTNCMGGELVRMNGRTPLGPR